MVRMDAGAFSDEYENSRKRYLSSDLAVIDRILCISCSPSNEDDQDRDGTCLREILEEWCQKWSKIILLTKNILRRGYRGAINAMTAPLTKPHEYLARLIMFFVRLL